MSRARRSGAAAASALANRRKCAQVGSEGLDIDSEFAHEDASVIGWTETESGSIFRFTGCNSFGEAIAPRSCGSAHIGVHRHEEVANQHLPDLQWLQFGSNQGKVISRQGSPWGGMPTEPRDW